MDGSQPAGISHSTVASVQRERVMAPTNTATAEQDIDPDQITPRRLTKLRPVPPIGGESN